MATNINWRLRIGFVLSAIIGVAWGILLGWFQVRLNSYLSPWLTLFVTMPLAFWGSVIAGVTFNRMLLALPKLARLLLALLIVAVGVPFGMIWALLGDGVEPLNLINSTGPHAWNLEWAIAMAGLFGGMWPLWMLPFLRPLGGLATWVLSGPASIVQWIGNATLAGFDFVGNAIMWLPRHMGQLGTRVSENTNTLRERQSPPPPQTIEPRHTRRSAFRRMKSPKRKPAPVPGNGNHNGARIVASVEDRCPYCLDIVKRNDRRGVRVCEVCGTPHHADCWAITGKCQVPHLNT